LECTFLAGKMGAATFEKIGQRTATLHVDLERGSDSVVRMIANAFGLAVD
jgi:hypothetical protein